MVWFLFSLLAGVDPAEPAATPSEPPTIVVRAERTEQELADCIARRCGVREDTIATIRHAQAQFAQGLYPKARATLIAALGRHGKAAETEPRAISALWYALAEVTLHDGDRQEYRRAALRAGSILANAERLGPDERMLGQVQIADTLLNSGDTFGAERRYRRASEAARARGDTYSADLLEVRAIASRYSGDERAATRRKLREAATNPRLDERARGLALALAAQLEQRPTSRVTEVLDKFPVQPADKPLLLIWAPTDKYAEQREAAARSPDQGIGAIASGAEIKGYSWADIGFWVRPDGRVDDVQLLRGSRNTDWTREVLRVIGGRRYAPFEAPAESEGQYRIERVTLTYDWVKPVNSLIRRRGGAPAIRFEEMQVEHAGRLVLDRP